jgi:uncharacterized membrane protein YfcA
MNSKTRFALIAAGAFAAGTINGLLGAGGGIILVFVLSAALGHLYEKGDEVYKRRDLMAISLSVMMPVSAVSALRYGLSGMLDLGFIQKLIIPSVAGGIAGGFMLNKLKESYLTKLFSFLVIYSGLAMIVR